MKKQKLDTGTKIVCLVLNWFIPGVGSLIARKTNIGIGQLILYIVSFPMMLFLIGFPMIFIAWVWALVTSIQLFTE